MKHNKLGKLATKIRGSKIWAQTRRFNGKKYELYWTYSAKSDAIKRANKERERGFSARVTFYKKHNGWAVWLRRL